MRVMVGKGYSGARRLARAFGHRCVLHNSGSFTNFANHLIVNWGCTDEPVFAAERMLNQPTAVQRSTNKLLTLKYLRNLMPSTTISQAEAATWLLGGSKVICRATASGECGAGISLVNHHDYLPASELYSVYLEDRTEYRVHVFMGEALSVQEKTPMDGVGTNPIIRNRGNGWEYDDDCKAPNLEPLKGYAVAAIALLGLDFGAVDLMVDNQTGDIYVLETNTAPRIVGVTFDRYVDKISMICQ